MVAHGAARRAAGVGARRGTEEWPVNMDDIPLWLLFVITTLLIVGAIELGYLVCRKTRSKRVGEKEAPVAAIGGTVLALLAFILAFTFSIVAGRYDARKGLVREQATAIRSAYARSDFLPEPLRAESKALYQEYIALVVDTSTAGYFSENPDALAEMRAIQAQLWDKAVENVRLGDNSDISASYVESVDDMRNVQAVRVTVALGSRIPSGLWIILYVLVALGMFAVGYQTAIAESRRSLIMVIMAMSFSIVICLIAALDNPERGVIAISQQPLIDLREEMK
jgi:hypothetical protein